MSVSSPLTHKGDTHGIRSFLLVETFISMVKQLSDSKTDQSNDLCYRFEFIPGEVKISLGEREGDHPLHTDEELAELQDRYNQMLTSLYQFISSGFVVKKLLLIRSRWNAGASFTYLTPSGRMYTTNYIRDGDASQLISDDFLHELRNIPNRTQ